MGLIASAGGLDTTGTNQMRDLSAGVMQTSSTGVISSSNGTNGQVIIGGGTAPAWANLASADSSVTITEGANTIDLSVAGGLSSVSFFAYCSASEVVTRAGGASGYVEYTIGENGTWTTLFNNGGAFYAGTGIGDGAVFTVPSSGIYFFSLRIQRYQSDPLQLGNCYKIYIKSPSLNVQDFNVWIPETTNYPKDYLISVILDLSIGDEITWPYVAGPNPYSLDPASFGFARQRFTNPGAIAIQNTCSYVMGFKLN